MCECTAVASWLPIPTWEGFYSVSTQGQVLSLSRTVTRRDGSPLTIAGGQRKLVTNPETGHLAVVLRSPGRVQTRLVAHLILETFVGPRPEGMQCCHWDDDPAHNHLSNLRWDTPSANQLDRTRNGGCVNANKTFCPREHVLIPPNLVASSLPRRDCLACARAHSGANYAHRTGRPFDFRAAAAGHYARIMGL